MSKREKLESLRVPTTLLRSLPSTVTEMVTSEGAENLDTNTYHLRRVCDRLEVEVKIKKLSLENVSLDETAGTVQTLVARYAEIARQLQVEKEQNRVLQEQVKVQAKRAQVAAAQPALAVHAGGTSR
jgi:hypothetical protein